MLPRFQSCSARAGSCGSRAVHRRGSPASQPLRVAAEIGGRPGGSSSGSEGSSEHRRLPSASRGGGRRRKARVPGLFEVQDVSPPPRSLGIHALPPNTHNGDQIEVEGAAYVVQSVVMQYKLVRGKYRRDHARLEVQNTGRMLATLFLEELYNKNSEPSSEADNR